VIGGILVVIGLAWILNVLDVVNLTLGLILPSALILVGLALLAGSVTGSHGGLVAVGVILTVVLTISATVSVPLSGGIGDANYAPVQFTDLRDSYELMIGNMNVDLSRLQFPDGVTTVETRVGLGELNIDVPSDVAVMVHWKVSGGNVNVFDSSYDGTNLDDHSQTPGYEQAAKKLIIEVKMGFGDINVRQP
jgi:predicted membrane protein